MASKINPTKELEDTPSVPGMVRKISPMVEIIEEKDEALQLGKN